MRTSTNYYYSGKYWAIDSNGIMIDDWYDMSKLLPTTTDVATVYTSEDGSKGTGWVYSESRSGDDNYWYYLVNITTTDTNKTQRSVPFFEGGDASGDYAAKVIKSKTYLFNEKGEMQDGRVILENDTATAWRGTTLTKVLVKGTYYFSEASGSTNGQMATGKTTVTKDGETYYYYFDKTNGYAIVNEVKDGIVYGVDGERVAADDGNSNMLVTLSEDLVYSKGTDTITVTDRVSGKVSTTNGIAKDNDIIVSSTGKLRVSGTVKIDGVQYKVSNGVATFEKYVD
jgi:hypothetical protein